MTVATGVATTATVTAKLSGCQPLVVAIVVVVVVASETSTTSATDWWNYILKSRPDSCCLEFNLLDLGM